MVTAYGAAAPYTVTVEAFSEGPEKDSRGSDIKKWAAPVPYAVYGFGPEVSTKSEKPGSDRIHVKRLMYVPDNVLLNPQDRVTIPAMYGRPALVYLVEGFPDDYSNGPFSFRPGLVVHLERASG